jgi:hypothetical protein
MKIILKNSFFVALTLLLVVMDSFAQEIDLYEIRDQLVLESNQLSNTKPTTNQSIFIQQIGENNNNSVVTNFTSTNITIRQEGNENDLNINKFGTSIIENVYQKGDNNLFHDYSALPVNNATINVNQFGNDLSIYNSGSNSISNSLSITQRGSNQMVIILNN